MYLKKTFLLTVSLAILALLAAICFEVSQDPGMERLRAAFKMNVKIIYDNFISNLIISRRPPLTTIELEERLKADLPMPFANFTDKDWQWFWRLLYGRFPLESQGWPRRKAQLGREEIEAALVNAYYRPFGYFREKQWAIFWQQILKGKVFK